MSFIIYSIFKLEVCMLWKLSSLLIELFSRKLIWWGEFKFIKTNTRSQYLANRIFDTQTSSYFQQEAVFFRRFVQVVISHWYPESEIYEPSKRNEKDLTLKNQRKNKWNSIYNHVIIVLRRNTSLIFREGLDVKN